MAFVVDHETDAFGELGCSSQHVKQKNGFGYDVAMVIASLADLAESLDPGVQKALALLQRQVKNGLTDQSAFAFVESGFADRVVASALAAPWPDVSDRAVSADSQNNR